MKERRISNRFDCSYPVHYSDRQDDSIGVITDVSLTGVRLSCPSSPEVGARVHLLPLMSNGARVIPCEVAWSRIENGACREAGLSFQDPVGDVLQSWVGEMLTLAEPRTSHLVQRRRHVRAPVGVRALAGLEEEPPVETELLDLSEAGALLASPVGWDPGTRLRLVLPESGVALAADVVNRRRRQQGWSHVLRFGALEASVLEAVRALVRRHLKRAG